MSRVEIQKYSVHRFRDQVALWDGVADDTVYLSKDLALGLAKALTIYAHDIETVKFTKSNIGTWILTLHKYTKYNLRKLHIVYKALNVGQS